jgi:hypothetical protein
MAMFRTEDSSRRRSPLAACAAALVASCPLFATTTARAADWIIKSPGDHPSYTFEAEPHALVGFGGPFKDKGSFGAGFRGTFVLVDNGFIKSLNDSVGITFGGDVFFGDKGTLFLPVAMQWNFWLTPRWSVFGEPGVALAAKKFELKDDVFHPIFMAGGRYHLSETVSLTLRAGYPGASVGVSFFL